MAQTANQVVIKQLFIYPIKSCGVVAVNEATICETGLKYDREWMIVKVEKKGFITQRNKPNMARIKVSLTTNKLIISVPNADTTPSTLDDDITYNTAEINLKYDDNNNNEKYTVRVWSDKCEAIDEGDEIANYLTQYLKQDCRLVRKVKNSIRTFTAEELKELPKDDISLINQQISLVDGHNYLVIGEASVAQLNEWLSADAKDTVNMNRFRPNIVVPTTSPFIEDTWKKVTTNNGIELYSTGKKGRCKMINVLPEKGSVLLKLNAETKETNANYAEPLTTLKKHRGAINPFFGQTFTHSIASEEKVLRVGDEITIQQTT